MVSASGGGACTATFTQLKSDELGLLILPARCSGDQPVDVDEAADPVDDGRAAANETSGAARSSAIRMLPGVGAVLAGVGVLFLGVFTLRASRIGTTSALSDTSLLHPHHVDMRNGFEQRYSLTKAGFGSSTPAPRVSAVEALTGGGEAELPQAQVRGGTSRTNQGEERAEKVGAGGGDVSGLGEKIPIGGGDERGDAGSSLLSLTRPSLALLSRVSHNPPHAAHPPGRPPHPIVPSLLSLPTASTPGWPPTTLSPSPSSPSPPSLPPSLPPSPSPPSLPPSPSPPSPCSPPSPMPFPPLPPVCVSTACAATDPYQCITGRASGGCSSRPWPQSYDCSSFCVRAAIFCDLGVASEVASRLNRRFRGGHPAATLAQAGVLLHFFENYDQFWLPNKARPEIFPCSSVSLRSPALADGSIPVWGINEPGVVLLPSPTLEVRCAYASDGNSQGRANGCNGFYADNGGRPAWCSSEEQWTMQARLGPKCAWRAEQLQKMLEQHERWKLGYNEIVLDGGAYMKALPSVIEAVIIRPNFYGGPSRAHEIFYSDYVTHFAAVSAPLLFFDPANWTAPFSPTSCG